MPADSATRVYCFDERGNTVTVARADLNFAPAVYGILTENARTLLLSLPPLEITEETAATELPPQWQLIGGRIQPGDTPSSALARYFRRSAGFAPQIRQLVRVETRHAVENGQPWVLNGLFYAVIRPSGVTVVPREGEHRPVWVPISDLARTAIPFGFSAITSHRQSEEET